MPSAFAHAFASVALGSFAEKKIFTWKYIFLLAFCGILPDADVLAFKFGIPYESVWGHRGFSHSICFAIILALMVVLIFYHQQSYSRKQKIFLFFSFFIATVSHTLLDGCTTGGLGVALFAPFDNSRYFLPWQVIKVSPIGVKNFFSERGIAVLKSELLWVGIPAFLLLVFSYFYRKNSN